ncbi:MAG: hypothetical protein IID39_09935, partial [Planctomycetes bacterium]|nr:hypothetical protein [Planctomycetota bacterium]
MDKVTRVLSVLAGQRPDRPPVSFWHHFDRHERSGPQALRAHLEHLRVYDLDFLKVMNDNGYPRPVPIRTVDDLASLTVLKGDEPEFARQLELIESLASELAGQVLMATTLFNAWATLRRVIQPKDKPGPPSLTVANSLPDRLLGEFLQQDREAVAKAIKTIGESLARFAARCLEAGADGIFLSVRDDWVDTSANGSGTYDEIVRPTDLRILAAAEGARF